MEDLNIEATKNLFEIFIDLTEFSSEINNFKNEINKIIQFKLTFPNLESIIGKNLTHEIFLEKISSLEKNMKSTINLYFNQLKKDIFEKYNLENLEKLIENFTFLFTVEKFKILRKNPLNRIKKIIYEDNSMYTGQVSKNFENKLIRNGFGLFETFPTKDLYLGNFENDNFTKGIFIKNSNDIYIGKFSPINLDFYTFEGLTISSSDNKINFSLGTVNTNNNKSLGNYFLIEDDKMEFFSGELINQQKNSDAGLLISTNNSNNEEDLQYTIIKGQFVNDIPLKNFEIIKPEFHVINIETDLDKPVKGFANYARINKGIYFGDVEFDDYSFFPCNFGNIIYDNNTFYTGEFISGKKSGQGIYFVLKSEKNYLITEGFFTEDELASGRLYNDLQKFNLKRNVEYLFDGQFDNYQLKYGSLYFENGDKYIGEFFDNKRNGEGIYYYKEGCYYEGGWKNNMKHGKGKYFDVKKNMLVEGIWERNKIENLVLADEKDVPKN